MLAEIDLTFAKAFETAQPEELSDKEEFHEVRIPTLEVGRVMWESICQAQTEITRFFPVSLLRPEETTFPYV